MRTTKRLALLALIVATLPAAGCAQLSSPQATQAAANVKVFVTAFACGLSSAAAAAQGVEATAYSGKPLVDAQGQQITAVVYASSTAACGLLGGVVTSAATSVPVAAVAR